MFLCFYGKQGKLISGSIDFADTSALRGTCPHLLAMAVVPRGSAMGFLQCLHLILEMWKRLRIQWLQVTVQNRVVGCIEVDVSCMFSLRRSQKSWKFAPKALNRRTQFATLGRCIMFVGPGSTRLIPCRLERFPNYFIETSSSLCVQLLWMGQKARLEKCHFDTQSTKPCPSSQHRWGNATKTCATNHSDVQLRSWQVNDLWLQQNYLPPHNVWLVRRCAGFSKHLNFSPQGASKISRQEGFLSGLGQDVKISWRWKMQLSLILTSIGDSNAAKKQMLMPSCWYGAPSTKQSLPWRILHCNVAPAVHLHHPRAVLPCKGPAIFTQCWQESSPTFFRTPKKQTAGIKKTGG